MYKESKFFSVMVVGEQPDELLKKYDKALKVEPYIKYKYQDAKKIQEKTIEMYQTMLKNPDNFMLNDFQKDCMKEQLKSINNMSSFEYYQMLTEGLYIDDEGNALTTVNPDGKWATCKLGKNFSTPLKLINGGETNTALNKEILWDEMHMKGVKLYENLWEIMVEGRKPIDDEEKAIFENMKNKKNYFDSFKNKEEFIIHNCAYWNYAYLDEYGWVDVDDENKTYDWISTYFDRFVKPLKAEDKVSIYECTKF